MANFLNQAGGLWARGALHGKVGGAPQQLLRQRRIRFRQKMKRFSRPLRTAKCLTGDSIFVQGLVSDCKVLRLEVVEPCNFIFEIPANRAA
jgi:hypothetical protein